MKAIRFKLHTPPGIAQSDGRVGTVRIVPDGMAARLIADGRAEDVSTGFGSLPASPLDSVTYP